MNFDKNQPVLAISAGSLELRKKDSSKNDLYINIGLLGLCTNLYNAGYKNVRMFQGDRIEIKSFIKTIEKYVDIAKLQTPLLLSMISFIQLSWVQKFTQAIKKKYPNISIKLGGRYVVDECEDWLRKKLPHVDFFCKGCPDDNVEILLLKEDNPAVLFPQKPFENLNYALLYNFRQYQPSIEVGRGCSFKCDFCLESKYKQLKTRSPEEILAECKALTDLYGDEYLNIYFESALFLVNKEWCTEFRKIYEKGEFKFKWRCTSRVDIFQEEWLPDLSAAGLKVVDIGLESASRQILSVMNKSSDPEKYLEKAEKLIKEMARYGVWAKVNIMIYAGETAETLNETRDWLLTHKQYIKGVSVNPLTVYMSKKSGETINGIKIDWNKVNKNGYWTFPYNKKDYLALKNAGMSEQDYYDLKKICYLPRDLNHKNVHLYISDILKDKKKRDAA